MIFHSKESYHTSVKRSETHRANAPTFAGELYTAKVLSALLLLVTGILTNDHDAALALDDLALFAHGLYRRPDLHVSSSLM